MIKELYRTALGVKVDIVNVNQQRALVARMSNCTAGWESQQRQLAILLCS